MALGQNLAFGAMTREETNTLFDWAAAEGWNPGHHDADSGWHCDPAAFVALRRGEELLGGGSIMTLDPRFGFMGLFIMRPDQRGQGLGHKLWHHRLQLLRSRLAQGATIAMEGVYDMVPFYAKGGFVYAHRTLRYEGLASGGADAAAVPLQSIPFAALDALDQACSPAPRSALLRAWVGQPGHIGLALAEQGEPVACGVARPALKGYKLGPVHARTPELAERLLAALLDRLQGQFVQIDIPEPNTAGVAWAERQGFSQSFGCARMYHGPAPALPLERIFGVMSLEFG